MIIGRFAENPASGVLIGHLRTLLYRSDKVVFEPIDAASPKAPTHRIFTGDEVELGCAWRRTAKGDGGVYFDVSLDDPTFVAPVAARLVRAPKAGTGYILLWDRAHGKRRGASESS